MDPSGLVSTVQAGQYCVICKTLQDILRKEAAQGQSHKCILAFFKCHYSITLQSSILQVQLSVTASRQSFWSVGHGSPAKCLGLPWALSLPLSLMVWGIFSWHTLGPLVPIEHGLNTTAYLSIVADHVHPFMTAVYPSSDAPSSRIMHHVTKLKSSKTGFLNMTMSSLYLNGHHSHQISIQ